MKEKIHPKYVEATIVCACGNTWKTRSTSETVHLDICSNCHPYFTGEQRIVDTAGRVERFRKRYEKAGQRRAGS
jgi:large subunit ribosomal protein L31